MPVLRRDLFPYQLVIGISAAAIGGIAALLGALRDEYSFTDTEVGVIVAAGFLASFVAQIALSPLADRGHARRMVVIGLVIATAAMASMAVVESLPAWVTARAMLGFGGGLILPGARRAATVLDPAKVGENLGLLVVGEVIGFMIGPVFAGLLAEVGGVRTPFIAFAVGLALFLPFATRMPHDRGNLDVIRLHSLDLLRRRRLVGALTLVGGYWVLIGAYESVIPIMFRDRGASTLTTGVAFTLLAIPIALVGPRAGRTADLVGPPRVAMAGISVVAVSTLFYGFLPGIVPLVALLSLGGVAHGFGFIGVQVAVSRAVPEERQAGALGLMGATEVAAAGLAAIPSAALYDALGAEWTWVIIGVISLVSVVVSGLLIRGTSPVTSVPPPLH